MIFIDLEKIYDKVRKEIEWKALQKKGIHIANIRTNKDIYNRDKIEDGVIEDFSIAIGLHHSISRCTPRYMEYKFSKRRTYPIGKDHRSYPITSH
ncbi:hypothetical protein Lal_00022185 [Lupinus albus]|nr:hypothetical protein Lal_00022185 [Lupinus albus]